ncbi:four-carbon acid sugar kinase family protein [Nesterenkonia massiliensis]|uniref:four-carbon acid sugar kinase family protein n=1 Tax=Nesterenkonia massiliensis TaxID=1232429 RepID=UPI0006781986|nr:four-carbon acid sugar kinase family protein [Nesterenkonia massiliensis]
MPHTPHDALPHHASPHDASLNSPTGVAIIADDLTGANDAAVQFARAGWDTSVVLSRAGHPGGGGTGESDTDYAFATPTDTRAASWGDAEQITADAVQEALDAGVGHLYLKVDSTIRGSLAAQVSGARAGSTAWRTAASETKPVLAVVCPAYPDMGRTVEDSQLLVHGVPVAQTALRDDPATPVTVSDLRELIAGSTALRTDSRTAAGYRAALESAVQRGEHTVIVDAAAPEDLTALAEAIATSDLLLMPVGSAGLAVALAEAWPHGRSSRSQHYPPQVHPVAEQHSVLIQVSSLNPASQEQVQHLSEHFPDQLSILELDPTEAEDDESLHKWVRNVRPLLASGVTVLRPPQERADVPRSVAARLGAATAALVQRYQPDALGFVGGDGAFAALEALNCTTLRLIDSLAEGVPLTLAIDGTIAGTPVFTKAGGFGSADTLTTAISQMRTALNRSTS